MHACTGTYHIKENYPTPVLTVKLKEQLVKQILTVKTKHSLANWITKEFVDVCYGIKGTSYAKV